MSIRIFPATAKAVDEDTGTFTDRFVTWLQNFLAEFNSTTSDVAALQKSLGVVGTTLTVSVADASVGGWATGVPKSVGSLLLPAGAWLVAGEGHFAGSVTGTDLLWQLTTAISNGAPAFESVSGHSPSTCAGPAMPSAASDIRSPMAPRVLVSTVPAPITVNALARIAFTAGTPLAGCGIRAVRLA